VDQCFSILTSEFKTEIRTVEELFSKIRNSPISPKPEVFHMFYIWDWREFIIPNFTDKMLANHSFYHSFQVKRDGERVSLRAKKYPQDRVWHPPPGIKLVKDNIAYDPVDVAPFRAEDLNLDKVMSDLRSRYFPLVSDKDRKQIESSWENLCTNLIKMPKTHLPKMKLDELVKQKSVVNEIDHPNYLMEHVEPPSPPELKGEYHLPTDDEELEFKEDVRKGVDVVLWTLSKRTRPWVGRVHEILNNDEFVIHWYKKQPNSNTFLASNQADGSPYLSKQPMSCVMFWQMSINATDDSFDLPEYEMKRIMHEYKTHDECYIGQN
jgi:hypothetical protein